MDKVRHLRRYVRHLMNQVSLLMDNVALLMAFLRENAPSVSQNWKTVSCFGTVMVPSRNSACARPLMRLQRDSSVRNPSPMK